MGELQSVKHLSKYGRPLWNALVSISEYLKGTSEVPINIEREGYKVIELAGIKLRNGKRFSPNKKHHVFAIFSQRLCLESVLSSPEAIELAEHSVTSHMRLLTEFSCNGPFFHTYSPSEPMLALGSAHVLYELGTLDHLLSSLKALSHDLCSAGLVEKGIMGELAARTLLLVARDITAPIRGSHRDLLKPVRLLEFLVKLFGNAQWAGNHQLSFNTAFARAYINFTHWIVTEDPMPEKPDPEMLANHWARGAAIQCCFTQKAIDFIIPVYDGSVDADAVFDPSCLTGIVGQVNFKASGDSQAETVIRPFGIPRDRSHPLPYIALFMELGCESDYQGCPTKKIKPTTFRLTNDDRFSRLKIDLALAEQRHGVHELRQQELEKSVVAGNREQLMQELKNMKKLVKEAKQVVDSYNHQFDSYNRYSISVRGASPDVYHILKEAKITEEFAMLLRATTILSAELGYQEVMRQHMFPSKRLGKASNHTAWWSDYQAEIRDGDGG
ncbi:hypothetical protein APHAL10511_002297 [Amanita phalloides]|nr:hypothetical protein APHAL10511_002297 [Amanita phalloides]